MRRGDQRVDDVGVEHRAPGAHLARWRAAAGRGRRGAPSAGTPGRSCRGGTARARSRPRGAGTARRRRCPGGASRMSWAATMPSRWWSGGIRMSVTTTSGWCSSTDARSASASATAATTVDLRRCPRAGGGCPRARGSCPRRSRPVITARSPRRSAVERERAAHDGAAARSAASIDERAAEGGDAVAHVGQAVAAAAAVDSPTPSSTTSIVEAAVRVRSRTRHPSGAACLSDVGQRLGDDEPGRALDRRVEARRRDVVGVDVDATSNGQPGGALLARRRRGRGRPGSVGRSPWTNSRISPSACGCPAAAPAGSRRRARDRGPSWLRASTGLGDDRDELLLGAVVQVTTDAVALGVLRLHQSAARLAQLVGLLARVPRRARDSSAVSRRVSKLRRPARRAGSIEAALGRPHGAPGGIVDGDRAEHLAAPLDERSATSNGPSVVVEVGDARRGRRSARSCGSRATGTSSSSTRT